MKLRHPITLVFQTEAARSAGGLFRRRQVAGFTLVEIAIALAIIAFALVAIIGILPSGLMVQKDSREKTIINEDARYFMGAIKRGAFIGSITSSNSADASHLQNFVEAILTTNGLFTAGTDYQQSWQVIGLLSTPHTNTAIVRAISGPAVDRSTGAGELAFRYQLTVILEKLRNLDHPTNDWPFFTPKLWDLTLQFNWPVMPNGTVGREEMIYRGQLSSSLFVTNLFGNYYFFFQP